MPINVDDAVKTAVKNWRKRLSPHSGLFSDAQQRAFLAEEVMSLVLIYAEAEKVKETSVVDATQIAAVYRKALINLGLE